MEKNNLPLSPKEITDLTEGLQSLSEIQVKPEPPDVPDPDQPVPYQQVMARYHPAAQEEEQSRKAKWADYRQKLKKYEESTTPYLVSPEPNPAKYAKFVEPVIRSMGNVRVVQYDKDDEESLQEIEKAIGAGDEEKAMSLFYFSKDKAAMAGRLAPIRKEKEISDAQRAEMADAAARAIKAGIPAGDYASLLATRQSAGDKSLKAFASSYGFFQMDPKEMEKYVAQRARDKRIEQKKRKYVEKGDVDRAENPVSKVVKGLYTNMRDLGISQRLDAGIDYMWNSSMWFGSGSPALVEGLVTLTNPAKTFSARVGERFMESGVEQQAAFSQYQQDFPQEFLPAKIAGEAAYQIPVNAPAIVAGMATGNPYVSMAVASAQTFMTSSYDYAQDVKDGKFGILDAITAAGEQAGIEWAFPAGFQKMGVGGLETLAAGVFKEGKKRAFGSFIPTLGSMLKRETGRELSEDAVKTAVQAGVNRAYGKVIPAVQKLSKAAISDFINMNAILLPEHGEEILTTIYQYAAEKRAKGEELNDAELNEAIERTVYGVFGNTGAVSGIRMAVAAGSEANLESRIKQELDRVKEEMYSFNPVDLPGTPENFSAIANEIPLVLDQVRRNAIGETEDEEASAAELLENEEALAKAASRTNLSPLTSMLSRVDQKAIQSKQGRVATLRNILEAREQIRQNVEAVLQAADEAQKETEQKAAQEATGVVVQQPEQVQPTTGTAEDLGDAGIVGSKAWVQRVAVESPNVLMDAYEAPNYFKKIIQDPGPQEQAVLDRLGIKPGMEDEIINSIRENIKVFRESLVYPETHPPDESGQTKNAPWEIRTTSTSTRGAKPVPGPAQQIPTETTFGGPTEKRVYPANAKETPTTTGVAGPQETKRTAPEWTLKTPREWLHGTKKQEKAQARREAKKAKSKGLKVAVEKVEEAPVQVAVKEQKQQTAKEVQDVIDKEYESGVLPARVVVVEEASEIGAPARDSEGNEINGATKQVEGGKYVPHIFAAVIRRTGGDIHKVAREESFHKAILDFMRKDLRLLISNVMKTRGGDGAAVVDAIMDEMRTLYPTLSEGSEQYINEVIAKIFRESAYRRPNLVSRFLYFVRQGLRAMGIKVNITLDDINVFIDRAIKAADRFRRDNELGIHENPETGASNIYFSYADYDRGKNSWKKTILKFMKDHGKTDKEIKIASDNIDLAWTTMHTVLSDALDHPENYGKTKEEVQKIIEHIPIAPLASGIALHGIRSPIRKNKDYDFSLELSGICNLRLEPQAYMNAVLEKLRKGGKKNALTVLEQEVLLTRLAISGMQRMCSVCYVDTHRTVRLAIAGKCVDWLTNPNYAGDDIPSFNSKQWKDARADLINHGAKANSFDLSVIGDKDRWNERLKDDNSHLSKNLRYYNMIRSASNYNAANMFGSLSYAGQFRYMTPDMIEAHNYHGGVRAQSFSDMLYENAFSFLQALFDLNVVASRMHLYTKDVITTQLFADTGVKINQSMIAVEYKDADGNTQYKELEGQSFPWDQAKQNAIDHPDVACKMMAINDEHIRWCKRNDWIHYVIPFHQSGMEAGKWDALQRANNWSDYEKNHAMVNLALNGQTVEDPQALLDWMENTKDGQWFSSVYGHDAGLLRTNLRRAIDNKTPMTEYDHYGEQRSHIIDPRKWMKFHREYMKRFPNKEFDSKGNPNHAKYKIGWFLNGKAMSDEQISRHALYDARKYGFVLPFQRFFHENGELDPRGAILLKDYGRTDTPQRVVDPKKVDMDAIRNLGQAWIKKGGDIKHASPKMVNQIVSDILAVRKSLAKTRSKGSQADLSRKIMQRQVEIDRWYYLNRDKASAMDRIKEAESDGNLFTRLDEPLEQILGEPLYSKVGPSLKKRDATHVNWERVKELGLTDDLREAGYITPEGDLIDLSGKKEGGTPGRRELDHREVGDGTTGMEEFIAIGNIRINGDRGQIDIGKNPTENQRLVLYQVLKRAGMKNVYIDIWDGLGKWDPQRDRYEELRRRTEIQPEEEEEPFQVMRRIANFYGDVYYSKVTLAEDARYMELAKNPEKNKAELASMVDKAAKAAGYNVGPVYHGTDSIIFNKFSKRLRGANTEGNATDKRYELTAKLGFFFNSDPMVGRKYSSATRDITVYLSANNIKKFSSLEEVAGLFDIYGYKPSLIIRDMKDEGYGGLSFADEEFGGETFVVFEPYQIKSADSVVYNNRGNIIPLSRRFNQATPDIRYSKVQKPKGNIDVIREVTEAVGLKHSPGRQRPGHQAYYDMRQMVSRVKGSKAGEIALALAMSGEHLNEKYKIFDAMPAQVQDESMSLTSEPSDTDSIRFGRFYALWSMDHGAALQSLPLLTQWMDANWEKTDSAPEMQVVKEKLAEYYIQSDDAKAAGQYANPTDIAWKLRFISVAHGVYTAMKDRFFPIYTGIDKPLRKMGMRLKPGESIYQMVQALANIGPRWANQAIENGVFAVGRTTRGTGYGNIIGKSLREHLKEIKVQERDKFSLYCYVRHAIECWEKKIDPGVQEEYARTTYQNMQKKYGQRFEKAAEGLTRFNNDLIKVLVDVGHISVDEATAYVNRWQTYVPLYRDTSSMNFNLAHPIDSWGPSSSVYKYARGVGMKFVNVPAAVRSRKGSPAKVMDVLDATMKKAIHVYSVAASQLVANQLVNITNKAKGVGQVIEHVRPIMEQKKFKFRDIKRQLEAVGVDSAHITAPDLAEMDIPLTDLANIELSIYTPSYRESQGEGVFRVIIDGKPQLYAVAPEVYAALAGMNHYHLPYFINLFFGAPARMVRLGATGVNLAFGTKNPAIDYQTYLFQEKNIERPKDFVAPWIYMLEYARYLALSKFGTPEYMKNGPMIELWELLGGPIGNLIGTDINQIRRHVDDAMKQGPIYKGVRILDPRNWPNNISSVVNGLREAIGVPESGPRIAAFANVLRKHGYTPDRVRQMRQNNQMEIPLYILLEAINEAHDVTVDFRRTGTIGGVLNQLIPFFNVPLEAMDKYIRTWADRDKLAWHLGWSAAAIAGTMAYWMNVRDRDDYKERDWFEKLGWWFIYGDNKKEPILRIPRTRELGWTLLAATEAILEATYRKHPDDIINWEKLGAAGREAFQQLTPPIPLVTAGPMANITSAEILVDLYANKKSFPLGVPITPDDAMRRPTDLQFDFNTAEMSKALSGLLRKTGIDVGPMQVDYALDQISGGAYKRLYFNAEKIFRQGVLGKELAESQKIDYLPLLSRMVLSGYIPTEVSTSIREARQEVQKKGKEIAGAEWLQRMAQEDLVEPWELPADMYQGDRVSAEKMGELKALYDLGKVQREISDTLQLIKDPDERKEVKKYAIGLARYILGKPELEAFPNPLVAKGLPENIEKVVTDLKYLNLKRFGRAYPKYRTEEEKYEAEKAIVAAKRFFTGRKGAIMTPEEAAQWFVDRFLTVSQEKKHWDMSKKSVGRTSYFIGEGMKDIKPNAPAGLEKE